MEKKQASYDNADASLVGRREGLESVRVRQLQLESVAGLQRLLVTNKPAYQYDTVI